MSYEQFIEKTFHRKSMELINQADAMIASYTAQGYTLTLRQLYYQFVARGIIENSEKSYKNLGNVITDARDAGLLPWDGIEDRNRGVRGWLIEEDTNSILASLPDNYAVDMWAAQDYYIEVWVEKEALGSVIQRAAMKYRVSYMSCKGYLSASEAYRAGKRMAEASDLGKTPVVIHLGDHDPSGIDMSRDNLDRLCLYSRGDVELHRIALNFDQVQQYNPPPNPTKLSDSRAEGYIANHGYTCWELDALEPSVLVKLIHDTIDPYVDDDQWHSDLARERDAKAELAQVGDRWPEIRRFLRGEPQL